MGKIIFTFLFASVLYAQQDTLLYKNYLDYYSNHAKSTVLTRDLAFLPDGYYNFKGDKNDFYYVLRLGHYFGKSIHVNKLDTIYLSGTIKDSIKIGQLVIKRIMD